MAYEGQQIGIPGLTASADLSAKQFYFVKMSGEKTVTVCAAATDKPIGVLQNAPTSGQAANVCVVGVSKVSGDADLNFGDLIGTSADGQADAKTPGTDTTEYTVGSVVNGNAAAGGLVTAVINCAAPARAA
ncbi:MAG TPA: hypothetical protein VLA24_17890 [Pseudomonadales bacterium]|nr:hypothetical protein [Pseudomonadales bacterium]